MLWENIWTTWYYQLLINLNEVKPICPSEVLYIWVIKKKKIPLHSSMGYGPKKLLLMYHSRVTFVPIMKIGHSPNIRYFAITLKVLTFAGI